MYAYRNFLPGEGARPREVCVQACVVQSRTNLEGNGIAFVEYVASADLPASGKPDCQPSRSPPYAPPYTPPYTPPLG
jgi:hypothetical protein